MVTRKEKKREKFEEWRMRIQSPVQIEYDKARAEKLKREAEYKKEKRKELLAKAKEATAEKLKEIEEYGTKTLKRVGEKIKKIDVTKEPKGYKQLQRGVSKIFEGKKSTSAAELKRTRAHQLKLAKLQHKQKMVELQAQAERTAQAQDPRYQSDYMEDQFLGETAPEQPKEEYYGQNYQSEEQPSRMRFLNGMRLRRSKSASNFRLNRLRPRNILNYENHTNKPGEFQRQQLEKQTLSLMQGTPQSERLRFTTAPSVIKISGNNEPIKVSFLGTNKPTKITVFGKTKL